MNASAAAALVTSLHVTLAIVVSGHIVLTKDDVRGAIGWVGLVWLTPVLGSVLYALFGVNRINRQARPMRRQLPAGPAPSLDALPEATPPQLRAIARVTGAVTRLALAPGCSIEPLVNGDEAYPAMLAAIDGARQTVAMASYIFDRGIAGTQFVDALARAHERGVQVRVLIDGVGARYSHPPIVSELRQRGVPVARFLPSLIPIPHPYFNMRNHRKMMVVDGTIGFCGGMNVRDACVLALQRPDATQDLHFRVRGPVVGQIMQAFAFDWEFTTHEHLSESIWLRPDGPAGEVVARSIPDGPDAEIGHLLMVILGAISQATRSIRVSTPYFLPDGPLVDAFRVAALRGVDVEILLPERGNLRLVQWASTAQLPQVLAWGCRVYLSPPPFDHTKLMLIDGLWSLIGSANLDPRSLRLNFEFNVECYSAPLARHLSSILDNKIACSRPLTLRDVQQRSLPRRVRDGVAWLAQPYL
jgi:cardiolipin synthase A/B